MAHRFLRVMDLMVAEKSADNAFGNLGHLRDLAALVLSDPKTGSTALAKAFQRAVDDNSPRLTRVIHMHTDHSCLRRLFPVARQHELSIKDLVDYRLAVSPQPLQMAVAYREPFSRSISHYFEHLTTLSEEKRAPYLQTNRVEKELPRAGRFLVPHVHHQLDKFFGLDLFRTPFDAARGIGVQRRNRVNLWLTRISSFSELEQIVRTEPGMEGFKVASSNLSREKWYGELYKQAFESLQLPANLVELILWVEQPYLEFFLDSEARSQLAEQWRSRVCEADESLPDLASLRRDWTSLPHPRHEYERRWRAVIAEGVQQR